MTPICLNCGLIPIAQTDIEEMQKEIRRLTQRLRDIATMPEYDQDDAHRLRHMAAAALPNRQAEGRGYDATAPAENGGQP